MSAAIVDPVRLMTLNQWDRHAYFNQYVDRNSSAQWTIAGPEFTEAYSGSSGGRDVVVANVRMFVSPTAVADADNGRMYATGAVAVSLTVAVPMITVLRPIKSLFGRHGWRSGNAQFDKLFSVQARPHIDDGVAAVLLPLVGLMASREDWTFAFGGPRLVCVTHDAFSSTVELQRTLEELIDLVSLIPEAAAAQIGHAMPTMPAMPDGTPFDPDTIEQQLAGLTPEQQAAFIVRMSGGHGASEEQIADAIRRGQGRS